MNEETNQFWNEEPLSEWVSFSEGVPVEIVIENATPYEKETMVLDKLYFCYPLFGFYVPMPYVRWGTPTVIDVWEFPEGQLYGGLKKLLKIDSKRLRSGIRSASPQGIPKRGFGYLISRTGEGFQTRYSVRYTGFFELSISQGVAQRKDAAQETLEESSTPEDIS